MRTGLKMTEIPVGLEVAINRLAKAAAHDHVNERVVAIVEGGKPRAVYIGERCISFIAGEPFEYEKEGF